VRIYLANNKAKFERVAFSCTHGGTKSKPLFDEMEALCQQHPTSSIVLHQKQVNAAVFQEKIRQLVDQL
jgi:hypothetical protein